MPRLLPAICALGAVLALCIAGPSVYADTLYEQVHGIDNALEFDNKQPLLDLQSRAEKGDVDAEATLGAFYRWTQPRFGYRDDAKSSVWLQRAAEHGDREAMAELGNGFYSRSTPDWASAAPWWQKAAEKGDAWSQSRLAECYFCGRGVKKDSKLALEWGRAAAEQGESGGFKTLSKLYAAGRGVRKDIVAAQVWCQLSVDYRVIEASSRAAYQGWLYCHKNFRVPEAAEKDVGDRTLKWEKTHKPPKWMDGNSAVDNAAANK